MNELEELKISKFYMADLHHVIIIIMNEKNRLQHELFALFYLFWHYVDIKVKLCLLHHKEQKNHITLVKTIVYFIKFNKNIYTHIYRKKKFSDWFSCKIDDN